MQEAGFLDALTLSAQVFMVTYNAQEHVFGIVTVNTQQSQVGRFEQAVLASAVNAAWPVSTRQGIVVLVLPLVAVNLACISFGVAVHTLMGLPEHANLRVCLRCCFWWLRGTPAGKYLTFCSVGLASCPAQLAGSWQALIMLFARGPVLRVPCVGAP